MAQQAPGVQQELAAVRQRIQHGKRKLAELESELQGLAKRTALVRSKLDADERREAQLLSALAGPPSAAANGAAAPAIGHAPESSSALHLAFPAPEGPTAAGGNTADQLVRGQQMPLSSMAMAAPVSVTFQPSGCLPQQQAAPPAYILLPTPAAGAASAPPAYLLLPTPAAGAATAPEIPHSNSAAAPHQAMNPGAAAFQPAAAPAPQGFLPRAVQLQHGSPAGASLPPPPGFHAPAVPVAQQDQQQQQQQQQQAPPLGMPALSAAQQAQQAPAAQQQQQHLVQMQVQREAREPKLVRKSPLAAFPMPGQSALPPQPPSAPAAPPPLAGGAAAPDGSGSAAGDSAAVAGLSPAVAPTQQPASQAESVDDLNAAMEAAALANAATSPAAAEADAAAEAEAGADAAALQRRRRLPQQQQPANKKKGAWGRGAGIAGGGGSSAAAAAAATAPEDITEDGGGAYEALLAGSYEQYVHDQQGPPEWETAPQQLEQDFPALGAPAPAAAPKTAPARAPAARTAAPPLAAANGSAGGSNPWASGSLKDRLARSGSGGAAPGPAQQARQAPQQAQQALVEEFEARSGLRVRGDSTPDAMRRRQTRKQTFVHNEKHITMRREVNVVEGIELHTGLLTPEEQQLVVDSVERWIGLGKAGQLLGRTFSAPKKWLPGKGRMTIQFGCCYNYARDAQGRDPGIIPEEVVEPMPPLLRALCRRLVRWGILPVAREPNSAIVNIYEAGDCIPPHVDHFDFVRPFATVSLLSEQCIMFGQKLVPAGPGEFVAREGCSPISIPLPPGSVCVLKGYGGDKAMHCVPPVAARRISITLRKIGPEHEPEVLRERQQYERLHGTLGDAKLAPL